MDVWVWATWRDAIALWGGAQGAHVAGTEEHAVEMRGLKAAAATEEEEVVFDESAEAPPAAPGGGGGGHKE